MNPTHPQLESDQMPETESSSRTHLIIIGGALLLLVLVGAVVLFRSDKTELESTPLNGYLYYTDDADDTRLARFMRYDIAAGQDQELFADTDRYLSALALLDDSYFYTSAPYVPDATYSFPYTDYLTFTFNDKGDKDDEAVFDNVSILRDLTPAPDGKTFAFSGLSQEAVQIEKNGGLLDYDDIRNFSVYIASPSGILKELPEAVAPLWLSDANHLYFLGFDGMYVYDTLTGNIDTVFFDRNYALGRRATLAKSNDGRFIALGAPNDDSLHVYQVMGTEPLQLDPYQSTTKNGARYPFDVFSLGESDIGFVEYDQNNNAQVTRFNTTTKAEEALFSVPVRNNLSLQPAWSAVSITLP